MAPMAAKNDIDTMACARSPPCFPQNWTSTETGGQRKMMNTIHARMLSMMLVRAAPPGVQRGQMLKANQKSRSARNHATTSEPTSHVRTVVEARSRVSA